MAAPVPPDIPLLLLGAYAQAQDHIDDVAFGYLGRFAPRLAEEIRKHARLSDADRLKVVLGLADDADPEFPAAELVEVLKQAAPLRNKFSHSWHVHPYETGYQMTYKGAHHQVTTEEVLQAIHGLHWAQGVLRILMNRLDVGNVRVQVLTGDGWQPITEYPPRVSSGAGDSALSP